jgi:DNA-directed RNA polymerase specialized sigma24 family protein
MLEGVTVIRKKLEEYHVLGISIKSFECMLEDHFIKDFTHLESVREYKGMILERIEQIKRKRNDIINLINRLEDPLLREIFFMRYIDQKSNEEIGRKVGYSVTHLSRKFREGIEELEKLEG